jgi:hypothetical protein
VCIITGRLLNLAALGFTIAFSGGAGCFFSGRSKAQRKL